MSNEISTEGFWHPVTGSELRQGDLLKDCLVPIVPDGFTPSSAQLQVEVRAADFIIITQSCDLQRATTGLVALCPAYTLSEFELANPAFSKKGAWEEVRKGRREGLHLLASPVHPQVNREAFVINFREIISMPVGYLRTHAANIGPRWRLQSPYLEHFSQAFARFFMRVGLPTDVPPFSN